MPIAKCKRERIIRLNAGLGGSDDDSNLLPACGPCNEGKRSGELLEFLEMSLID